MKTNISENPKNRRISTYLTDDEMAELMKIIGDESVSSWLRSVVLKIIVDNKYYNEYKTECGNGILNAIMPRKFSTVPANCNCK